MPLSYRNRSSLMEKNPELVQALDDINVNLERTMNQTNSSPTGQTEAPPAPSSLVVNASQGIFDASITDHNPVNRGINYFLEYSPNPGFTAPTTVDLGQSRNFRGHFGNQTLYWRAHSAYPTSPRSDHAYHGSQSSPVPVSGGGSIAGPALSASQGSGTTNGATGSDGAFGNQPYRRIRPTGL